MAQNIKKELKKKITEIAYVVEREKQHIKNQLVENIEHDHAKTRRERFNKLESMMKKEEALLENNLRNITEPEGKEEVTGKIEKLEKKFMEEMRKMEYRILEEEKLTIANRDAELKNEISAKISGMEKNLDRLMTTTLSQIESNLEKKFSGLIVDNRSNNEDHDIESIKKIVQEDIDYKVEIIPEVKNDEKNTKNICEQLNKSRPFFDLRKTNIVGSYNRKVSPLLKKYGGKMEKRNLYKGLLDSNMEIQNPFRKF